MPSRLRTGIGGISAATFLSTAVVHSWNDTDGHSDNIGAHCHLRPQEDCGRHLERRLTAILAADIAGYSRLMDIDETGTLVAVKRHLTQLIAPAIADHRGRTVIWQAGGHGR